MEECEWWNCIPTAFILKEITDYVAAYHTDMCITDVEKDHNRFKVELNDHLEIEFSSKGKFISYDDWNKCFWKKAA